MTIVIDEHRAIALLEDEVSGNEGFVYEDADTGSCVYEALGYPSCLVGKALFRAGVTVDQLRLMDDDHNDLESTSISCVSVPDEVELSRAARQVFGSAQGAQDCGLPWRVALEAARERYAEVTG